MSEAAPPAERGHLSVAPKAVETIAARAGRASARRLGADQSTDPAAKARVAGARTSMDLTLTLPWGQVVEESARTVHREVRDDTTRLSGLTVDDLRLTVGRLASPEGAPTQVQATDATPKPAPAPRGAGPAVAWGLLLSVAVLALGAVAAHDALAVSGAISEDPWLPPAISAVDGTTPEWWVLAGGVVAVVLGLVLVVAALRPRPRRALTFTEPAAASLLKRDLARAASGVARQVDGVLDAKADAGRRRVRVWVETTGDDEVLVAVRERLAEQFAVLAKPPRVTVLAAAEASS